MDTKETEMLRYKAKIDSLRIEYNDIISRLARIKEKKLFYLENSKAMGISSRIADIKKKMGFLKNGLPINGYADHHEDFDMLD